MRTPVHTPTTDGGPSRRARRHSPSLHAPRTRAGIQGADADRHRFRRRALHVLKDATSRRFVPRDALGCTANADLAGTTPFHMQATALGSYLFYARVPAPLRSTTERNAAVP